MAKASISKAWDETRQVLSQEAGILTSLALALLILPSTIIGTAVPTALTGTADPDSTTLLLAAVVLLIGLLARITFARIAIGPPTTVGGAIRLAVGRLGMAILAFLLFFVPLGLLMVPVLFPVLANRSQPPPGASLAFVVLLVIAFALGVRLLTMVIPAAAADRLGPLALLKASWRLTKGSWWRLAGFVILFFVAATVASQAMVWVLGGILIVATGELQPFTLGALILAAALALVGSIFAVIFAVMIARIYVQLAGPAGGAEVTVPNSGT